MAENSHHWVLKDVSVSLPSDSLSSSWWEYLLVFPWENIQLVASLILYLWVTELILAQLYRPSLTTTHGRQDLSFLTRDQTHGPWNGSLNLYLRYQDILTSLSYLLPLLAALRNQLNSRMVKTKESFTGHQQQLLQEEGKKSFPIFCWFMTLHAALPTRVTASHKWFFHKY